MKALSGRRFGAIDIFSKYGAYITFALLLALNSIFTKNFYSINVIWNIIIQSATTLLIAEGMTIVISGGGINLAVGAIMALASVITASMVEYANSVWLGIALSILTSAGIGLIIGLIIAVFEVQPMIVTIAFATIVRGVAMLFRNGGLIQINNLGFTNFAVFRFWKKIPIQVLLILITLLLVYFLMRKLSFGRYIEAIGNNRSAAHYAGVNTLLFTVLSYVICSTLAGLSGILEASRIAASNAMDVGVMIEMDAVASTVIGGTLLTGGKANIVGTMIGVFIMQTITIMINMNNITYEYSLIIKAMILLGAATVQQLRKK